MTDKSGLVLQDVDLAETVGSVASAVYVAQGSELTASELKIDGLSGPEDCKFSNSGVIVADLAASIQISETEINDSGCSYLYSDRTPITVADSTFIDGQ